MERTGTAWVNYRVHEDGTIYEEQRTGWLRVHEDTPERIALAEMIRARARAQ